MNVSCICIDMVYKAAEGLGALCFFMGERYCRRTLG